MVWKLLIVLGGFCTWSRSTLSLILLGELNKSEFFEFSNWELYSVSNKLSCKKGRAVLCFYSQKRQISSSGCEWARGCTLAIRWKEVVD